MIFLLPFILILLSSCQEAPHERHYTEVIVEAPDKPMADPHAGLDMSSMNMPPMEAGAPQESPIVWQTPSAWQEVPGKGMRLVSFHLTNDPEAIDCSIVSLGGMAGGLEANLRRWMGQLKITPSPEDFAKLMSAREIIPITNGVEANIYDFTLVQKSTKPSDKSIIVAMINMNESTIFMKMTGKVSDIKSNRKIFLELVKSIKSK